MGCTLFSVAMSEDELVVMDVYIVYMVYMVYMNVNSLSIYGHVDN